jgi:hypothetical protein
MKKAKLFWLLSLLTGLAVFLFSACNISNGDPTIETTPTQIWNRMMLIDGLANIRITIGNVDTDVMPLISYSYLSNARVYLCIHEFSPVKKTIKKINLFMAVRTGSFSDSFLMSGIGVYDLDGNLKRTLSTTEVDLKTTPLDVWSDVTLPVDPSACVVNPGEIILYAIDRLPAPGGTLAVAFLSNVEVE